MPRYKDQPLAIAAFVTVCIVWGTTYLAIRVAVQSIPPILMTGVRYTIAGAVLLAILRLRGHRIPTERRTLLHLAVVAVLLIGIGTLALVIAEQWVPSGIAALLIATGPFWAAIIEASRRSGERIHALRLVGMAIGFSGVTLLLVPGSASRNIDRYVLIGAILIQFSAIAWQSGSIYAKNVLKGVSPLMSAAMQALIGGVLLDIAGLAAGEGARLHPTTIALGAWAYLAIFGTIIGYSAYTYALSKIPVTTVSLHTYVNPVIAVILGWLILGEQLTPTSLAGMVIILIGMTVVQRAPKSAAESRVSIDEVRSRAA
jgi:drug/metabolite transporter (DMT)-like permease